MVRICGANESIRSDQQQGLTLLEEGHVAINKGLRGEPLLFCAGGDVHGVLVGASEEADLVATHPSPTRDDIRPNHLIERMQAGLVVCVGNGRRQVVPHRVRVSHTIRPPYVRTGMLRARSGLQRRGETPGARLERGATMNKVILAGRMTKPVEIKSLPSGSKVAVGSLASHDYRGGEERTEFHRLVFWEKLAEIAATHLQAGSLVAIDGRLKTHEWESEGARRWMTEVIVNRLEFLGPKPQSAEPVSQGGEPTDLSEAEYGEEIAPARA